MRSILAYVIVAGVLITDASEAQPKTFMMIGAGQLSCGSWTTARHDRTARGHEQWVMGFLSGLGYSNYDDPLKGVDAEGVWAWMDNHCRAQPLITIMDAAVAFATAHPL